ncbi:MAG: hypothetical protein R2770_05500 [Acidimicrobiales bacterium]
MRSNLGLSGTVRLSVTDASYFVCGRRAPSAARTRLPRKTSGFARLRSWGKRLGDLIHERPVLASAVLFARPSGRHLAIAGACGVSGLQASLSAVLGTIAYLALIHQGLALL